MRDLGPFFGELRDWSAANDPGATRHAYGTHPDQHADLRLPAGHGPHPTVVVIHGGFWRAAFTKENTTAVAIALTRRGFATWNVEYRRVGSGGGYPTTLEDVRAACRAAARGDETDTTRFVAFGHSAGGHLALWALADGAAPGAVSLAGITDLGAAERAGIGSDAVAGFLGGIGRAQLARYRDADPISRIPTGGRALLVHGTQDDRVPLAQSRAFVRAAAAAGDDARLLELAGADHLDPLDPRGTHWPAIAEAVDALVS
jgi:acetyl esterase/lipase